MRRVTLLNSIVVAEACKPACHSCAAGKAQWVFNSSNVAGIKKYVKPFQAYAFYRAAQGIQSCSYSRNPRYPVICDKNE